jgi:hypothetical protein
MVYVVSIRAFVAGSTCCAICLTCAVEAAARQPLLELPVRILTAWCDGKPARSRAWIQSHVKAANRILSRHRVRLRPMLARFDPDSCEVLDRATRHAMARHAKGRQPVVLVVRRVRDVDVPSYDLMGVHWRYRGGDDELRGRRWVFLTARAEPPVLAHELCHFFGLPHDPAGGNLMTPGPSDPAWSRPEGERPQPFKPRLTKRQARRLRRAIRRHLKAVARERPGPPAGDAKPSPAEPQAQAAPAS